MPARHGRARPQHAGRFGLSGWPLRRKVALALLIPLILAATLGGLRVRSDLVEAADASSSAKQVTVLRPVFNYVSAAERAMVAAHGAFKNNESIMQDALADLKDAARELQEVSEDAELTARQRYQVDAVLDLSQAMRTADTEPLTRGTWVAEMRLLQSAVNQLVTEIVNAQINPEPRLEQLSQALGGRASMAIQHALAATERTGSTGSLELYREVGAEISAIDRLANALGDTEPEIAALRTANAERAALVRREADVIGGLNAYDAYDSLISQLLDGIDHQLDTAASDARNRAILNGGITLAALLAAILLAMVVSRLLLRPIRRVREGALAKANAELPEAVAKIRAGQDPGPIQPVDVHTHEEIGQVARAVDDLHRQAVVLASAEAQLRSQVSDMFVTLSRRSNSLINQQLDLIEQLERDEEDAKRLESLFRLDHLAARMRRTAESLLVLADAPPTRATSTDALTVADALQAATAAVQDYQRVRIGSADNSRIRDTAAADVVHLLTELVDNALSFSPPNTGVTVESSRTATGVAVEISDAGLGIPEDSLAELNEMLRSGGEVTPDTARRMGLLVVSRLAQRHGISVSLTTNQHRGITARVTLPTSILEMGQVSDTPSKPTTVPELNQTLPSQRHPATSPDELGLGRRAEPAAGSDLPSRKPREWSTPATSGGGDWSAPASTGSGPWSTATGGAEQQPAPPGRAERSALTGRDERSAPVGEGEPSIPVPAAATAGSIAASTEDLPLPEDSEGEAGTPIFRAVRSAWLSTDEVPWASTEVEAGWNRADQVTRSGSDTRLSPTGLPVRQPGERFIPGSVTKSSRPPARDPEAIRARLAAHAEGVSRGRSAAGGSDRSSTEADPS